MALRELVGVLFLTLFGLAVAGPVLVGVAFLFGSRPVEKKYGRLSSGGVLFDQAFQPTAFTARQDWESQKIAPVPAPSPDKGPGVLDLVHGTIEIRVDE